MPRPWTCNRSACAAPRRGVLLRTGMFNYHVVESVRLIPSGVALELMSAVPPYKRRYKSWNTKSTMKNRSVNPIASSM